MSDGSAHATKSQIRYKSWKSDYKQAYQIVCRKNMFLRGRVDLSENHRFPICQEFARPPPVTKGSLIYHSRESCISVVIETPCAHMHTLIHTRRDSCTHRTPFAEWLTRAADAADGPTWFDMANMRSALRDPRTPTWDIRRSRSLSVSHGPQC